MPDENGISEEKVLGRKVVEPGSFSCVCPPTDREPYTITTIIIITVKIVTITSFKFLLEYCYGPFVISNIECHC